MRRTPSVHFGSALPSRSTETMVHLPCKASTSFFSSARAARVATASTANRGSSLRTFGLLVKRGQGKPSGGPPAGQAAVAAAPRVGRRRRGPVKEERGDPRGGPERPDA